MQKTVFYSELLSFLFCFGLKLLLVYRNQELRGLPGRDLKPRRAVPPAAFPPSAGPPLRPREVRIPGRVACSCSGGGDGAQSRAGA